MGIPEIRSDPEFGQLEIVEPSGIVRLVVVATVHGGVKEGRYSVGACQVVG
jgi:hypothetical protein